MKASSPGKEMYPRAGSLFSPGASGGRLFSVIAAAGIALVLASEARAQTTLLAEGFEGVFPGSWSVGDANATGTAAFWDDQSNLFGTVTPHSGSWKGYCAGIGFGGTTANPLYQTHMQAYMSRSINLAGYSGANLSFWYSIPSTEPNFDFLRVYMDAALLWETSSPTAGWGLVTLPLNAYVGAAHTLKFEFISDVSVVNEGAYLDDILVEAANQPVTAVVQSLEDINYSGYVLDSDTTYGRSNVQAQAVLRVQNFTGGTTTYSNVMSFRLLEAGTGTPQPIYDAGNTATNSNYTYNITNVLTLAAGTNFTFNNIAHIRPAAWLNQFNQYYLECRLLTSGGLAQTFTAPPATYYHFTNIVSGDPAYNVLLNFTSAAWSRTYAVNTVPGQDTFQVNATYEIRRWDDWLLPVASANVPVVLNYTLRDSGGTIVPLSVSSRTFTDPVTNYLPVVVLFPVFHIVNYPTYQTVAHNLDIRPAAQLDSVTKTYFLTVTLSHTNNPVTGQVLAANRQTTPTAELLHFNGRLFFGSIATTMNALGPPAPPPNPPTGGVIPTVLNGVGGYLTAKPSHTFSGGGPLAVNLNAFGDALVTGGNVIVNGPLPDTDSIAGVNFRRGPVTLTQSGATADLTVTLPTGFGYRTNDTNSLVLSAYLPLGGIALSPALYPIGDQAYGPGTVIYAAEESKPVWLVSDRIEWRVNAGVFELPPLAGRAYYVRAVEYENLQSVSNLLVDPVNMGDKRSNDKYWLALNGLGSVPSVVPDGKTNSLLSSEFLFGRSTFRAHFPHDSIVQWGSAGSMKVVDDLVAEGSGLAGASQVGVTYTRDCPDCGGGGSGTVTPLITIPSGQFNFTPDGGLVAMGTLPPIDLQWGYIASVLDFAQTALQFSEAAFHMPGCFMRGDQHKLPAVQRPTTILYSGFLASDVNVAERPLGAGYSAGLADYAGLNFRAVSDGAHGARSTIAGQTGISWLLDYRSKYYVRPSGVSGIHEAVPGSFPSTLKLWDYDFTFTGYGVSYLDSQNWESVTDGAVSLPKPAGFVQNFKNMLFTCLGSPKGGDLPPGEGYKSMFYWVADFKTLSLKFNTADGCDPTAGGFLVLGIQGHASHVDKPLFGEIGFFAKGDQIPPSFTPAGVKSQLKLPNVIKIDGPNKSTYTFTPVQDAYYNTFSNSPPSPTAGWMNIYGKLDVPFFEDLQLHLQTSCRTNGVVASNAPIHLSGGWPRFGTTNDNFGWLDTSGRTPFQTNQFDWKHLGWPGTLEIAKYRDNTAEMYHPRAQRVWLGFITFDYPLSWNTTMRTFKSWKEVKQDLFVVNIEHEVKYLDAIHADLDFGAQYDGLPKISIANLAFNAIDEATGVGSAIAKAAAQPVADVLAAGLDQMGQLLDTQMKRMMDGVFDKAVNPVIDQFYNQLHNEWNALSPTARLEFVGNVYTNGLNFFVGTGPLPSPTTLRSALEDLGNGANQANNLIGQIRGYLGNATNAIESIVGVINTTTNGVPIGSNVVGLISKVSGARPVAPKLVQSLVGDIAPQFVDAVVGPVVTKVIQEIEPQLQEVSSGLKQTENALLQVDAELKQTGAFTTEIQNTLASFSSQLSNVSYSVSISATQYFGQFDFSVDNPFVHVSASDLKKFIRQKVEDQFFATDAAAQIQTALRQRLYDVDAAMKQQVDSVFQQMNSIMRDLISQSLAQVDNSINKCLGKVSNVIGAGKLNGHASIEGDSLKLLRIDGHFQFKVPDDMELDAFLEIKDLTSNGSSGCYSSNAPATEVTIGATGIPLSFAGTDAHANVKAKFTFDGSGPLPVNLGGTMELLGELNFEAFKLHDLGASLAFGEYENYVAFKGGVKFNSYDFSGAIFFGKTCSLDPLLMIDPDVAEMLGPAPFTGAYCYAQGWLPISEMVLGVPASCMFEISAGVGAGAFYFAEGPTYGGKMFLGVSGELLCIVSIEGDITMIGVKHGDDLAFTGKGHFEAEVGSCPFCFSVSKNVSLKYANKSWHID